MVQGKRSVFGATVGARFIELKAPVGASRPLSGEAVVELLAVDVARITLRFADSSPALPGVIAVLRKRV